MFPLCIGRTPHPPNQMSHVICPFRFPPGAGAGGGGGSGEMQGADPVSPGASLPQGRPSGVFRSTRRARLACRFFQTPRQGRACARRRAGRPGPPGFRSLGRWSGRELTWVPTVCLPPSRGERPGRSPEGDGGTASPECGPEAGATRRGRGLLGPARPSCRRPPAPASVTDEGWLRGLRAPTGMLCGGRALPSHSRGVCLLPPAGKTRGKRWPRFVPNSAAEGWREVPGQRTAR